MLGCNHQPGARRAVASLASVHTTKLAGSDRHVGTHRLRHRTAGDVINDSLHCLLVPLPQRLVHCLLAVVRPAVPEADLELLDEPPLSAQTPRDRQLRRTGRWPDVRVVVTWSVDERRAVGVAMRMQPHLILRGQVQTQGACEQKCNAEMESRSNRARTAA